VLPRQMNHTWLHWSIILNPFIIMKYLQQSATFTAAENECMVPLPPRVEREQEIRMNIWKCGWQECCVDDIMKTELKIISGFEINIESTTEGFEKRLKWKPERDVKDLEVDVNRKRGDRRVKIREKIKSRFRRRVTYNWLIVSFTITISLLLDTIIEGVLNWVEVSFGLVAELLGFHREELVILHTLRRVDGVFRSLRLFVGGGLDKFVRVRVRVMAGVLVLGGRRRRPLLLLVLALLLDGFGARGENPSFECQSSSFHTLVRIRHLSKHKPRLSLPKSTIQTQFCYICFTNGPFTVRPAHSSSFFLHPPKPFIYFKAL